MRRAPDRLALIADGERLTYAELGARVTHAACVLGSMRFDVGSRIGFCLRRRAGAIVAIHAVLRLGLVYVPLDPDHPVRRRNAIARDGGLRAIIVENEHAAEATQAGVATIPVDLLAGPATMDSEDLPPPPDADDAIAYIIHTSGSTGRPKGVAIRHRSLANLITAMARRPGLEPDDVVLGTASFAFDMSIPDIFLTCAVGATLVLASERDAPDGRALLDLVARHRVTAMQSTPSRLRLMLAAGWPENSRVRLKILCGGEAMTRDLADALVARGELWNMYGPTETTVWSTARRIESGADIALGGPIDNTSLRVADTRDDAFVGQGELLIAGDGVAAGYLNRPDLTAERFMRLADGTSFYRTGDLVAVRADGNFDYLGRDDHQIKFNGVRIEPGEIEAVLASDPSVAETLVTVDAAHPDRTALIGYVRGHAGGQRPDASRLDALVRTMLPIAMRPRIVVLDWFPLNANGKIDRAALRDLGAAMSADPDARVFDTVPLVTATEHRLAAIWSQVLDIETVGRHADFLGLGGDSLAATAVDAEIASRFGVRLGVATLLSITELTTLASHLDTLVIDHEAARRANSNADAIQTVSWNANGSGTPVYGLHNLLPYRALAGLLEGTHPFHSVALSRRTGLAMLKRGTVEDIGLAYADAIMARNGAAPAILIGWCAAGPIALDAARRLREAGADVQLLILIDPEPAGLLSATLRVGARTIANLRASGTIAHQRVSRTMASRTIADQRAFRTIADLRASRTMPQARGPDDGGFVWLEGALTTHKPKPYDGAVIVGMPVSRRPIVAAWRRHVWRRILGPETRFVILPGDHASVFEPAGAEVITGLIVAT